MTVRDMKKLLKGLANDMMIMMDTGDGVLITVCAENSQVVELPLLDDEDDIDIEEIDLENTEIIEIVLLVPCNHPQELEVGELNSKPELN